jgi:hypothetical protein
MIKKAGLFLLCILVGGTASASFELEDPASEILADTPEANAEALAKTPCFDLLLAAAKDARQYKAILARLQRYHFESDKQTIDLPTEDAVRTYCVDNPKSSLKTAADMLAP